VRHKKKSKKKSAPPTLQPSEEGLITSLLQDLGSAEAGQIVARVPSSLLARVLVERLPLDESSVPLLSAIDEGFQDKQVRKAVKRVLFKLENKGVSISDFHGGRGTATPILKPPQEEEPVAFLGPLDMTGARPVLITLGRTMRGIDGGMGIVSDEEGIQQFRYGAFSKKWLKGIKEQLSQEAGPLVETTLAHATTILEEAYQRHLEVHSDAPEDYLEVRPRLLDKTSPLDVPAIYEFISEDSVSQGLLTDSQIDKLFRHELMESWVVAFEELRPFMEDISKVDDSPIVLTEGQKSARAREIEEKCMEVLFPAPKRAKLKRRFEEMAYIFFKLGQEDSSRLSLAAALSMDEDESILRKNPVIEHLVKRSLNVYADMMQKNASDESTEEEFKGPSPGIIIP
jgi:hypothetical protein